MKPLQVFLDEQLHKELKLYAVEHELSISDLIRQAVESLLETRSKDLPKPNKVIMKTENHEEEISLQSISQAKCKNGHPLVPNRDKCIAKGCKYSLYGTK